MSFISYAQNFEDVMLWRALKHIQSGFYIDVGANDPSTDSVTKAFYEKGWRGINIEPVSEWFEKLSDARPRDINLQLGAGAREGEITLYEIPETGLSTIDKVIAERHQFEQSYKIIEQKVFVRKITDICEEYHVAPIHFLKIDVEGAEKLVLEGIDFSKIRPWIVLVESTLPSTQIENHKDWEPILLSNDYEFAYFDGLNRFYVAKEHAQIKKNFSVPPNLFDCFIHVKEVRANSRAEQAESQVVDANLRVEQREKKVCEVTNRAEQAEDQVQMVMARAEQAEEQVQMVTARAEQAEEQVQMVTARTEQAEHQVQMITARAEQAEEQVQMVTARAEQAEEQVQMITARAEQAEDQVQRITARAEQVEALVYDLYNSKSWRMTLPLRKAMLYVKRFLKLAKRFILWALRLPKCGIRYASVKIIFYVLKRPVLKFRVMRCLQNYPGVKTKLKRFALISIAHNENPPARHDSNKNSNKIVPSSLTTTEDVATESQSIAILDDLTLNEFFIEQVQAWRRKECP